MRSRRHLGEQTSIALKLGLSMLRQLDRLEELDRIAPQTSLDTGFTIDGIEFKVTAKVAARGVKP